MSTLYHKPDVALLFLIGTVLNGFNYRHQGGQDQEPVKGGTPRRSDFFLFSPTPVWSLVLLQVSRKYHSSPLSLGHMLHEAWGTRQGLFFQAQQVPLPWLFFVCFFSLFFVVVWVVLVFFFLFFPYFAAASFLKATAVISYLLMLSFFIDQHLTVTALFMILGPLFSTCVIFSMLFPLPHS